ncbi:MAG TPA: PAS domain S-box protein [Stenomitos sp.]
MSQRDGDISPTEQEELLGGMTSSQDITSCKPAERQLCQLKDELEAKVQQRTAELMKANEQLQQEIAVRKAAEKGLYESQVSLKLINTISTGITTGMQPLQVIERVLTQLSEHFTCLQVAYSTIDQQGMLRVIQAIAPPTMPALQGFVADLTAAPDYLSALRQNQPQIVADISADIKLTPLSDIMLANGTKAFLAVPLRHHTDGLIGLLCFNSPEPCPWSPYEVATLIEVADYLSITLKEARSQHERTKAETALRDSEERYRLLVELSPETILVQSEGNIAYINPAGVKLLGARMSEELIGTSLLDRIHPVNRNLVQQRIQQVQEEGQQDSLTEIRMVRVDGQIIDVESIIVGIVYEGKPAVQILIRDITQRKLAEAELQAQAQLLDLAHDTIMVRDLSDRIIFWNQGAVKMYGYTRSQALGQNVRTLLQSQFPQPLEDIEAELLRFGRWEGELLHTRADGSCLIVASRWALQRDEYGIPVKILEINNDITERKKAEQELLQSETMLRSFCEVTAAGQLYLNQCFDKMLAIGCQHFGLEFGFLAHIEGHRYEIIAAQTPNHSVAVGAVFDARQSYCLEALRMSEPLCIQHASAAQWRHHPAYVEFQMETYIGMRVIVNNSVYGILCFCSHVPSRKPFNAVDKELLKLMAQWIGNEIERYSATEALEQLRHQNELILNSAGEGICGVDSQGNITFVNPAAAKMLGYQVKELMNQPIPARLCHREDGTPCTLEETFLYAVLQDGKLQHFKEQVFWRKDGSCFPVECIATPMTERGEPKKVNWVDGQIGRWAEPENSSTQIQNAQQRSTFAPIVGAVITFRDITERLAVERMKDEFISVVSHELRTPLTAIRGSLGLVAGGLLTTQPQKAQRMLEIAAGNTDRLTRLINDILDIERIESGKVQMEKKVCNVRDLILQTVEDMQSMAQKVGVTLAVSPIDAQIQVDRDRMIQVFTNLISNAIKFSPPNTTVEIIAELPRAEDLLNEERFNSTLFCSPVPLPDQSNQILFQVRDRGRGIPEDKLETIFGRFQQVNASDSRDKGGTGLGLAICRSIVQQHEGYIWAESKLDEGSTFCFTLPVLVQSKEVEEKTDSPSLSPPLVLLCDDDTSIHGVIKAVLENRGYRVVTVASGEEAIAQAALLQPSVILLDLLMPRMNGWETMAILKEQPDTKHIPIIIFSGWASEEDKSSHPEVANWLSKPLTMETLFETIKQSLKQQAKVTRVLVVEDDLDLGRVLTTMFERHGIEAYHATSGREAIQMSQHVLPDLLLLDLVLPEVDGYAVVEWLRLYDCLHEVPLVVYSAQELTQAERDRLALGPTEFFTKGRITPEHFEQRVIALLNRIVTKPEHDT